MKQPILIISILVTAVWGCQENQEERIKRTEDKYFDVSKYKGNINTDGRMVVSEINKVFEDMYTKAIEEHGLLGAIDYCGDHAFDVLDSLGHYYGVGLKRTSLKYRSPENAPDSLDYAILNNMKDLGEQGVDVTPMSMKFAGGDGIFYAPIKMKSMCLPCHGMKLRGDIKDEVWKKIRERYPDDKSYDFNLNEMVGVWGVYFPAEYRARKGSVDIPKM